MRNRMMTTHPTGLSAVRLSSVLLSGALVSAFAVMTAVGAQIRIPLPFTPVPVTLQTLVVFLAGGLLGARRGLASQVLYLSLGALGLPVFAAGSAAVFGPTGGYLIGFAAAALLIGRLLPGSRTVSPARVGAAMAIGLGVIYLFGVVQLAVLAGVGLGRAVAIGVVPFLPGDAAKLAVAAGIVAAVRRRSA